MCPPGSKGAVIGSLRILAPGVLPGAAVAASAPPAIAAATSAERASCRPCGPCCRPLGVCLSRAALCGRQPGLSPSQGCSPPIQSARSVFRIWRTTTPCGLGAERRRGGREPGFCQGRCSLPASEIRLRIGRNCHRCHRWRANARLRWPLITLTRRQGGGARDKKIMP